MSADGDDGGPGEREVAHRLFAAEFEDAAFEYSESDEDRAPNYVVTPTGARVNRLFVAGVLTEVETVNEDTLRGRVVDPTGAFVTYAGQYQPDEVAFLDRTTPPAFVSLAGKGRTFQPDDSDVVYTSVRPERLNEVDADTRDAWVVDAARATLRRVGVMAAAREFAERGDALRERLVAAGVDESLAAGVPLALDHYGTTAGYLEGLREVAVQALGVVADEREEVAATTPDPAADGDAVGPLPTWARLDESAAATEADTGVAETDADPDSTETAADVGEVDGETSAVDTDATQMDTDATAATADTSDGGQSAAPATETESTTATGDAPTESTASGGGEPAATTPTETATATDTGGAPTESTASEPDPGETPTEESASETDLETETDTDTDDLGSFEDTGDASVGGADGDAPAGDAVDGDSSTATVADDSEPVDATDDLGSFDDTGGVADDGGDLGSFEDPAGGADDDPVAEGDDTTSDPDDATEAAVDPADVDEDDLDDALTEEEREEVMAEHDVSFSTGTEVPDPEESELDAPDPEEIVPDADEGESTPAATETTTGSAGSAEATTGSATETTADDATETADAESETDSDDEAETPDLDDVNLTAAVVDVMAELNDGDGVDREEVLAATVDRYGASPEDVEEAIQDALMNGQCYEAGGGLKPI
ncbi:rpa-associated protein [Halobaculum sp. MBLA0147]|uniref:rpa-associated protein n=1 Tax=Halobaculum sp. MBLA0147 TaxID=3079934 RepID=UPI003526C168